MKLLLLILPLLMTQSANANESSCYSISNVDQKNVCLALVKKQSSYCYSVQNTDTKNICLAQTKMQRRYCYSISSPDVKKQCLALVP
jgi:hypothetical protein